MTLSRRDFLRGAVLLGGTAATSGLWSSAVGKVLHDPKLASRLTTLGRTIVRGAAVCEGSVGKYYRLAAGPAERHLVRTELGTKERDKDKGGRRSLVNFAQFTDIHLIDAQSPARVEFLDRFADPGQGCESVPFNAAFRPQETLTLHVLESMVRMLKAIRVSPISGAPLSSVICTGDNIDNEQFNELRWFIDLMDGHKQITPNSGGGAYEGVQAKEWGDVEYYHPEAGVSDKYKQQYGFPNHPSLLGDAVRPFKATGVGIAWYQTFGNHDGLMQGNAPRNEFFEVVATGGTKISGPPPGLNPCNSFQTLRDNPTAFAAAPARQVGADDSRRIVKRSEYIEEMFRTTGTPIGHGFTKFNRDGGVAYWYTDSHPGFRFIGLDTVNPGGEADGSIGEIQFDWLEERLLEVSKRYFDADGNEQTHNKANRYVILFSHHGLRSLDNPVVTPDPLEPGANDLPRKTSEEIEALVHRFPNVIAWVNGHSHLNVVEPRQSPHRPGGFWDIGTAAHIDWSCQSRLVEVVDNRDGTLSIFGTMFDHAAPILPGGSDPVLKLASIARELAANDYQAGFDTGRGEAEDRNVELVLPAPFPASHGHGWDDKRRRRPAHV